MQSIITVSQEKFLLFIFATQLYCTLEISGRLSIGKWAAGYPFSCLWESLGPVILLSDYGKIKQRQNESSPYNFKMLQ